MNNGTQSSSFRDLKDESITSAVSPAPQQATPELLKAILSVNPNVFDQTQRNHWGNHVNAAKFNGLSPSGSYNYASHQSSPASVGTVHSGVPGQLAQSSPHVNMGSPPSQARPGHQLNVAAQNNVSPLWNSANSSTYTSPVSHSTANSQNGGFYNSLAQDSNSNFGTSLSEDKDPLSMSPGNSGDTQRLTMQTQEKVFEQGNNSQYSLHKLCTWFAKFWSLSILSYPSCATSQCQSPHTYRQQ